MDVMNIYLHNTLTGKKEVFKPIHENEVGMYHCGPTVYSFAHIGNMRAYVFADILRRTFEYFGFKAKQVINITDVGHLIGDADSGEDKVEETAKKEGKTAEEITGFYEKAFHSDLADLNIETDGTIFPKATKHIKEQTEMIKILEERGFAYKTSDGIYFDTGKFKEYGKLGSASAKAAADEKHEFARIEINNEKRNPSDFALWKFSPPADENKKRLQEWESPWGIGFPGWHIECSAMSRKYLGQPFDIHTGGIDHIPVHHNNEIAQSEAAYGVSLADFWMHNEFLSVEGEKMSKSLGNTFTISDLKNKKVHPLAFRLWLLSGHYRSPMNFTWDSVLGSHKTLEKLAFEFGALPEGEADEEIIEKFEKTISDNLDTPKVLAILHETFSLKKSKKTIEEIDKVLGINVALLSKELKENISEEIMEMKKERDIARQQKNWQKSDELRKEIEREGYILEDRAGESILRKNLSSLI
jgi:cysteinyl-tRNA synthetase